MKRITRLAILLSIAWAISSCSCENGNPEFSSIPEQELPLKKEILGEWVAGELYFSQPPVEVQQSIKDISFQPDNIIKWSYVSDGKMKDGKGRYMLFVSPPSKTNLRELPSLFVAPESYKNPGISSVCLLKLTHLEIDFDARFHVESIGKVLKAKDSNGKALLFVRKGKTVSSQPTDAPDKK
jgi:hypothetical protein